MNSVVLEVKKSDYDFESKINTLEKNQFSITDVKKFDGSEDILRLFILILPITVPIIGKIILDLIKNKRFIKVKVKGKELEFEGLSYNEIVKVLKSLEKNKINDRNR